MKHPVDAHVGQKLRHRRWLAGMTQQQLGEAVGIKFQQIQKYETGMNRISASRLWDLSRALDVPVSFFFDGLSPAEAEALDAEAANADVTDVLKERETVELVRAYYAMPPSQRKPFYDMARALAEN